MNAKKTLLIACGQNEQAVIAAIEQQYQINGYHVFYSDLTGKSEIEQYIKKLVADNGALDAFIYLSPLPQAGSILGGGADILFRNMNDDLEVGMWWVQSVSKQMTAQTVPGRIVTLAHITALVPTEQYSYCSASQLALMNLCRSGIQELAAYDICINIIFRGFSEQDPAQKDFVEKMKSLHKDDGIPLMVYTQPEEVAKTCFLLTDPTIRSFNGAMVTLDGGFYVTRKIRYLEPTI